MHDQKLNLYVVIPVRNRITLTENLIKQLLQQDFESFNRCKFIFVDSSSTDGTYEMVLTYSKKYENFTIIKGKKRWYWARAAQEGIDRALETSEINDYILLLNDDIYINSNYLELQLQHLESNKDQIISSRVRINEYPFKMLENFPFYSDDKFGISVYRELSELKSVDFNAKVLATGKGTSYPVKFLRKYRLDFKRIPHHMADLDLSLNAHKASNISIITPLNINIFTELQFGTDFNSRYFITRYFHKKSPSRFISTFFFYVHMYGLPRFLRHVLKDIVSKGNNIV